MKQFVEHDKVKLENIKPGSYALHGDVILFFEELPDQFKNMTQAKDNHLALGEMTGHSHTLFGEELEIREDAITYTKYLITLSTTTLKHQEHRPIVLPPNTTARIGIQREYDPFSKLIRKVAD